MAQWEPQIRTNLDDEVYQQQLDLLVGNMQGEVHWLPGKRIEGKLVFGPPEPLTAAGEKLKAPSGEAAPVAAAPAAAGRRSSATD